MLICSDRTFVSSDSVVVLGFIYCERDGSDSVIVLGFMYVGRVVGSVRGSLATACYWRWRFPPDRWGPLAVTGGNLVVQC